MAMLARTSDRPTAEAATRLDAGQELERLAGALARDLNGGGDRRVDVQLERLRRAVDQRGGRASLGRAWHRPWRADHHALVTTLLARRRLRLGFDADLGWVLAATDRSAARAARAA